jgi:hypothetical protein
MKQASGSVLLTKACPGACIIKLITAVIYNFRYKVVFVPSKPLQPSLLFRENHSSLLWKL